MTAGLSQVTAFENAIAGHILAEMSTPLGSTSPTRESGASSIIISDAPPSVSDQAQVCEEEDESDLISDPSFRVKCRCMILTYQVKIDPEVLHASLLTKPGMQLTWCHEEGTHIHTHVCLEGKFDCMLKNFYIDGIKCDCRPCRVKGNGYISNRDRMHFYVICKYKISHIASDSTYMPCKDYVVRLQWIKTLWQKGKISDPVGCAVYYMCITEPFRRDVALHSALTVSVKRKRFHDERLESLKKLRQPFKKYANIELWKSQYRTFGAELPLERYQFLLIFGPSRTGKSKLAESFFECPFKCAGTISWKGYDPDKHDGIVINDLNFLDRYIDEHHDLLQCGDIQTVNTSTTDCYAMQLDIVEKPIVFTSEYDIHRSDWVSKNCIFQEVLDSTYE